MSNIDEVAKKPRFGFWTGLSIGVMLMLANSVLFNKVIDEAKEECKVSASEQSIQEYSYDANNAGSNNFSAIDDLANRGNYQAQRNLAYSFSYFPYPGQKKNPVLGCAWYLVVLNSGSPKVDSTDQDNVNLWCGKLEPDLLKTSKYWASKFLAKIDEKTKLGKLDN